jgi:hypothetical protein
MVLRSLWVLCASVVNFVSIGVHSCQFVACPTKPQLGLVVGFGFGEVGSIRGFCLLSAYICVHLRMNSLWRLAGGRYVAENCYPDSKGSIGGFA